MPKEYVENLHDYRVMYEGCLAALKPEVAEKKGIAPLVLVRSFSNEVGEGSKPPTSVSISGFKLQEVDLGVTTKSIETDVKIGDLSFELPEFGFVNTGKSAFRVYKTRPQGNARYRRLPVLSDIKITNPVADILERLQLKPIDTVKDYEILSYWANNTYVAPKDAIKSLFNGESIARAINKKFCFVVSDRGGEVYLMYDNYIAGSIPSEDSPVKLEKWARRFSEELESFGLVVK